MLTVVQGESTQITFTLTNLADLPDTSPIKDDGLATAGYTVSFIAKLKLDDLDDVAAIAKDSDGNGITIDSATVATVTLDPDDTTAIAIRKNADSISLRYSVRIVHSSGSPAWIPIENDTLVIKNAV